MTWKETDRITQHSKLTAGDLKWEFTTFFFGGFLTLVIVKSTNALPNLRHM